MSESRIKWCLADVMKEKGCRNKDLVSMTGLHAVTISKLKHADMPERLERSTLEKLCDALECEPGDLMWLNKRPSSSVESTDSGRELSQKKNLSRRPVEMKKQPSERLDLNQEFNSPSSDHVRGELLDRATTIDYCAGSLVEEIESLPQKTREQISPLLSVLRRASKEQLAMLSTSGRHSFSSDSGQLEEVLF